MSSESETSLSESDEIDKDEELLKFLKVCKKAVEKYVNYESNFDSLYIYELNLKVDGLIERVRKIERKVYKL